MEIDKTDPDNPSVLWYIFCSSMLSLSSSFALKLAWHVPNVKLGKSKIKHEILKGLGSKWYRKFYF